MSKSRFFSRGMKIGALFLLAALPATRASADGIGVTYTVSGSSGAWILDFSVTNNLNAGQDVYLFGVLLPAQDIVASPAGWTNCVHSCTATTLNTVSGGPAGIDLGGPNITFNNLWHEPLVLNPSDAIPFGDTLSGFEVEVTSVLPPTSVEWFAYGADITPDGTAPYTGGGEFMISGDCLAAYGVTCAVQSVENPGFAGSASVPEPSSALLLAMSFLGVAAFAFRRGRVARRPIPA